MAENDRKIKKPLPNEKDKSAAATSKKKFPKGRSKVICDFSMKGGVGKTVISINLALSLAKLKNNPKVIIVDLNLYSGDVCSALNLKPQWTISDLAENIEFYSADDMEKILTHFSPNVKVLAAPLHPELAETITPEIIHKTLAILSEIADYIVIDCPSFFSQVILAAIEHADRFFLIATVDLLAIKSALICLQTLQLLNYPQRKIKFILNRSQSKVGISDREIERSLGIIIWATVPSDKAVPTSVNMGLPLVENFPKSPVSRSFSRLALHIKNDLEREEKMKKSKGEAA